jgi:Protein of unknown function (DUF1190)
MNQSNMTQSKRRWSSAVVAVSVLSVGSLLSVSGCERPVDGQSGGNEQRRNQYQSRAECEADYSAKECEQQTRSGGGFLFLGPMYMGNWRNQGAGAFAGGGGPGRAAMASPTGVVAHPTQTTRGGFGATGRSYSNRGG